MPESVLSRCRRYAECVEWCLWAMAKRCKSRSEKDILGASDRTYRAISALEGSGNTRPRQPYEHNMAPSDFTKGSETRPALDGIRRPVISKHEAPYLGRNTPASLRTLTIDKWRTCGFQTSAKTWTARAALNCQSMLAKLSTGVTDGEIVPFYAEYMDAPEVSSPGFFTSDARIIYMWWWWWGGDRQQTACPPPDR